MTCKPHKEILDNFTGLNMRWLIASRKLRKVWLGRWPVVLCPHKSQQAFQRSLKSQRSGFNYTLIIGLVVLHYPFLPAACPAKMVYVTVKQILLMMRRVAFIPRCPPAEP